MSSSFSSSSYSPAATYFCHQCDRQVQIQTPTSPSADILCPNCDGGFVEKLDTTISPSPNPHPSPNLSPFLPFLVPSASTLDIRHPSDLSSVLGGPATQVLTSGPRPFDPYDFIQGHLGSLLTGGATIQIVFDGAGGASDFGPMGLGGVGPTLGDYFIGSGLEQLIQQLSENDPNRYGTPPASKSVVAALPNITVSDEILASDGGAQCAVCMDAFDLGSSAKQLPCKHIFHKDCILPWLELHSSCPVCRHELPTDDNNYQESGSRRMVGQVIHEDNAGAGGGPGGAGDVVGASPGRRVMERRFRISLPWAFRGGAGSREEGSNVGGGQGSGGGEGSRNDLRQDEDMDNLD